MKKLLSIYILLLLPCLIPAARLNAQVITTYAGGLPLDGVAATNTTLNFPGGVAVDASGNIYIADASNNRIRKINTSGIINTIAGTGTAGYSGDGNDATAAKLSGPTGVAIDASGSVYIADKNNHRIRKVNTSGVISTVGGTGTSGYSGDGGAATLAKVNTPTGVAIDGSGNVYIADRNNHRIRKINTSGIMSTVAGTGTGGYSGDGFAATIAKINMPNGVAVDGSGNIYIADLNNQRIRKITSGTMSTIAGSGTFGYSGDGGAATAAAMEYPYSVTTDGSGNVYFSDQGNQRVRMISSGVISTVAGTGTLGYNGDGIAATAAELYSPYGLATDGSGNLYIADQSNHRIREVNTSGTISTVAGGWIGDGGPATAAKLYNPTGAVADNNGNVYIADRYNHRVRKCDGSGIITTIAGTGSAGFSGDGGAATAGALTYPFAVAMDNSGNIYIADAGNNRVRMVNTSGDISTIAGTGTAGFSGNGGAATAAMINFPTGVAVDATGNVYIADFNNHRIRMVNTSGIISTYAGTGTSGYSGDGGAANAAMLNFPNGIALDAAGNLYIADANNSRVRKVNTSGIISTFAGTGTGGYSGNGGAATAAMLNLPRSVAVDTSGNVFIAESGNNRTRVVNTSGIISLLAGNGTAGYSGDGDAATAAMLDLPYGVATDHSGNVYIAHGNVIRMESPIPPVLGTSAVCEGATITLSNLYSGGTWTSSNTAVATVGTTSGIVGGVTAGTSIITYSLYGGTSVRTITVNPLPSAIIASSPVCESQSTTLSDADGGGTWSSSNTTIASIGSTSGIISGGTAGNTTISYTFTSTTCSIYTSVTVNPFSPITGPANVCEGHSVTLSDPIGGGTWASSNTSLATVNSSGEVSGLVAGIDYISYTLPTGCIGTLTMTVNSGVTPITGTLTVCANSTTTLSDGALGGTWSSDNVSATINSSTGVVTGTSAGTSAVTYVFGGGCTAYAEVTVNPLPATITGNSTVCEGLSTSLSETTSGGTWSSSNTAIATVGTSGTVSGVLAGTSIVSYTLTTGCYMTNTVTVNQSPTTIYGTAYVCESATTSLSNGIAGGTWSSSNGNADIGSANGVVFGISAGNSTISYALGNGCTSTTQVTVNPLPATITGNSTVCEGLSTSLSETTTGGTWSSSNTSVATVGTSGTVSGLLAGTSVVSYTLATGCYTTNTVTINQSPTSIYGTAYVCEGASTSLSNGVGGGLWSSSNGNASVGSASGVVSGTSAGNSTISYALGNGCTSTTQVTVNPLPATITGNSTVCEGLSTSLSETTGGGTWSSSNTAIATVGTSGAVTGVLAGTSIVSYTLTTGCYMTNTVTVNQSPTTIYGTAYVCEGASTSLSNGVGGGLWSSSNGNSNVGSANGVVSGISAGNSIISYALGNGCTSTTQVTVNPLPATITGNSTVCEGLSTSLSETTTGGTWSSSNTSVATVGTSGAVSGLLAGTSVVSYTLATGCYTTNTVIVNQSPTSIYGTAYVCEGASTSLSNGVGGGLWSSSNGNANVGSANGVVSGISAGNSTISYALGNGCTSTTQVTVNPVPAAITGAGNVCEGLSLSLSDLTAGGIWSSSSTTVATIGTTGIVSAVLAGTSTISYTLATGCYATTLVTVDQSPTAISGGSTVCIGSTITLGNGVTGGSWAANNSNVAIGSAAGNVTGSIAGTSAISYTLTNGCSTNMVMTVNPLPANITGNGTVCENATVTLSETTVGGTWSSSNTNTATVGTNRVVTGVSAGSVSISYTLSTGCAAVKIVTVNPVPSAILGATSVCKGSTTTLSDPTPGGVWASSNGAVATIGSTRVLSGVAAGTATISYSLSTGCRATRVETVNPIAAISGSGSVCETGSTTLSDATAGGTWSNSNTAVLTVGSAGAVTGVAAGSDIVTYQITATGCTAVKTISVNPLPNAISGSSSICAGLTITLTDNVAGGSWTSSNTNASVGSLTGIVTGVNAGTATITYGFGASCSATISVTVNPFAQITGAGNVCEGQDLTLSDIIAGGVWSSNNTGAIALGSTGIVTGSTAGTDTVYYTLPSGCTASKGVTVNPLPSAIIADDSFICAGLTLTLSDGVAGGTWSSSNSAVASIGSITGIATGASAGTATITYGYGASCSATISVTVNAFSQITGNSNVCEGQVLTLSIATPGGTWSSSNTTVLTVDGSGVVTAVVAGAGTISYALPSGCTETQDITVNTSPTAITGSSTVCKSFSTTLSDGVGGGVWTSSTTLVATIGSSSGIVNGVSPGTATITYSLGSCRTTMTFTVNPQPVAITGSSAVCEGASVTLSDPTAGGTWSSSSTDVATVGTSAVVSAILAGTTTISYTLPAGCFSIKTVTVNTTPTAISGTLSVCKGFTTTLSDDIPGGIWSSSSTTIATVGSASGTVNGVAAGNATISYTLGSCRATTTFTVNPQPAGITGSGAVCEGLTMTLSDGTAGGDWSSSNTDVATIGSTRVVNGILAGTTTISYVLPAGCFVTKSVTVNASPDVITGTTSVCKGFATSLSDDIDGGTWSSSTTTVATVGTSGVVTGVNAGTATISYTLPGSCQATVVYTVNPQPAAISGSASVCEGLTITLSDATASGDWSSTNTDVATIGSARDVNGILAGTTTISYVLPAGCFVTKSITVNTSPDAITGTASVCRGSSTTLSDDIDGGTWSSSSTTIATIGTDGTVTSVAAGTTTISYTMPGACRATVVYTVNPQPGAIGGSASVCEGLTITLSNSTAGGDWSSTNTDVATIGSTRVVTGILAGTTTISYVLPAGCFVTKSITVNTSPDAITGTASVCKGSSTTLSDDIDGGTWSSSSTTIATIGTDGTVTSVAAGTTTISYTLPGACRATVVYTVNPQPGAISGSTSVCEGLTITLSNSTAGGDWSSTNTDVATIGSTRVVSGILAGTTTISYVLPAGCYVTKSITVNASPDAITGAASMCKGFTTSLSDDITGGTWSSSTTTVATIGTSGVVTGVNAGTATISYSLAAGCKATVVFTVNPQPGAINGSSAVCEGSTITLSDGTAGGAWTSSNTSTATVGSTRAVLGVLAGTTTISYTLPAGCYVTKSVTVNTSPDVITGTASVCKGFTTSLSDDVVGGIWSSSTTTVATIGTSGVVTSVNTGTSTVSYTLGSCRATVVVTVNAQPAAISGPSSVCEGQTITLSDPTANGTWSSSSTDIATVGTSRDVTGVFAGTAVISYTLSGGCSSVKTITVNASPTAISGPSSVAVSASVTLSDGVPGGIWSAAPSGYVTIGSSTGEVSGVSTGTVTVVYSLTGGCTASYTMTVDPSGGKAIPADIKWTNIIQSISVTPNPNNGTFVIKGSVAYGNEQNLTIQVSNMLGQNVYNRQIATHDGAILEYVKLSNIANGMYLLTLQAGQETVVYHLVIEQ